jgi:hypothetical protein
MMIVFFALLLVPVFPGTVFAQGLPATPSVDENRISTSFEFYPSDTGWGTYFEPKIDAGSSAQFTVLIANTGDVAQSLRTYATDVFTAPEGGGLAVAEYGSSPNEITGWLDYSEEVFAIEVGQGMERTFTLTVPEDTEPGHYVTAVAAEHAEASGIEGSENFRQKLRYVVPIFITVPGEMSAEFSLGDISLSVQPDVLLIQFPVVNSGDVNVRPEGTIEFRDEQGELIATIPIVMQPVYARDDTILSVGVPGGLPPGRYQVEIEFTDPDSGAVASVENSDLLAEAAATPEPQTIVIASASVTPAPAADDVQFANVDAVISNFADPVANAQLSLIASVGGAEVERFPISQSLSLPTGDTPVATRYIPATGWTTGEWTFELLLETVEPNGAAVVVGRLPIEGTVVIP